MEDLEKPEEPKVTSQNVLEKPRGKEQPEILVTPIKKKIKKKQQKNGRLRKTGRSQR